jgi:thiamine biosynthesis protein ThiS
MILKLNGSDREVLESQSLLHLLASLGLPPARVAIERNGEIVPRELYPGTVLADGDCIEIVQFVGGG